MKSRFMRPRTRHRWLQRSVGGALIGFALLAELESVAAQAPLRKMSGEVVRLEGSQLTLQTGSGSVVDFKLADHFQLSARSAADPAALTVGAFVGTTAIARPDGTLLAQEVHVFPESMRGRGEGHRPMDTQPGSTMTNATIAAVGELVTVAGMPAPAPSRRLTLRYKGGEKVVAVPDSVPIVLVEPADRSLLSPGAHVVVSAATQPDGSLLAERAIVGKNGFVPPP